MMPEKSEEETSKNSLVMAYEENKSISSVFLRKSRWEFQRIIAEQEKFLKKDAIERPRRDAKRESKGEKSPPVKSESGKRGHEFCPRNTGNWCILRVEIVPDAPDCRPGL